MLHVVVVFLFSSQFHHPITATCFHKQKGPFRKFKLLIPVCFDSNRQSCVYVCARQKILKVPENPQSLPLDRLGFMESSSFELGFTDLVGEGKVLTQEDCPEGALSCGYSLSRLVTNGKGAGQTFYNEPSTRTTCSLNSEAKKL